MGFADHARLLVAYNAWANHRVLEQALTLDDAALQPDGGASKGSILGNLQHILTSEIVWLRRWRGEPTSGLQTPPRTEIRSSFEAADGALQAFAATLDDADWNGVIDYNDTSRVPHRVPLGVLITHVINHGTLHRGEAGMLLAAHDRSPGDLDFVYFVLEQGQT